MLKDLGFHLIPEINTENLSFRPHNGVLYAIFLLGILFVLSPLYFKVPFTSIQVAWRTLMTVSIAVTLRCLTFISTILPTPGPHCSPDTNDTLKRSFDPPTSAQDVFLGFDTENGCGDLIFSSHMMYALVCTIMITDYSIRSVTGVRLDARENAEDAREPDSSPPPKSLKIVLALLSIPWLLCIALAILIVAQRSHYTVDVLVAWYTVPLVWVAFRYFFPWDICINMRFWADQPKTNYELIDKRRQGSAGGLTV